MKTLMLGNEAVARGLYEAGCSFVSSYPGTPSTESTEAIAKYPEVIAEWAPNEKVAMEAAFGAALAGKRSFHGDLLIGSPLRIDLPILCGSFRNLGAGCTGVAGNKAAAGLIQAACNGFVAEHQHFHRNFLL